MTMAKFKSNLNRLQLVRTKLRKIRARTQCFGLYFAICFSAWTAGLQYSLAQPQESSQQESHRTITVGSDQQLAEALKSLANHSTIEIRAGRYRGGWSITGISNLTVKAADPAKPPLFEGGNTGWQFSRCKNLKLAHLKFKGQKQNGVNIDDGGQYDQPVTGVELTHLHVSEIGPNGNFDGIKLSGLDDLRIDHCQISGWGGQAIDMVGCHDVRISDCQLIGKDGFSQNSGIQCKGGSENVLIEKSFFKNAGQRPINAGGSTDLAYFRPHDAKFEAKNITIQSNMFIGAPCACAFVGVDGAKFVGNRVNYPEKWVFRVLQETTEEGFAPCRNVVISNNNFIFKRENVRTEINIGPGTQPETFTFQGNHWFAEDQPSRSQPNLPVQESDATYGEDPREVR